MVINYRGSRGQAEALAAQVGGLALQADVADPVQVQDMVDNVLDKFCQLDILVCNAGISQQKLFGDLTDADWRRMFAVNVDGVFHSIRAVLPHFIHRKAGRIVTVSSMWGQVGGFLRGGLFRFQGGGHRPDKGSGQGAGPLGHHGQLRGPGGH